MDVKIGMAYAGEIINVPGFEILSITGRDKLTQTLTAADLYKDGELLQNAKIEPRELTVSYLLYAPTPTERSNRMRALTAMLLKKENARLMFSDDMERYLKATVASISETEIVFRCSDPYFYSLVDSVFTGTKANPSEIYIVNEGALPVSATIGVKLSENNGYLSIRKDEETKLEFGDPSQDQFYTESGGVLIDQEIATQSHVILAPDYNAKPSIVDVLHPNHYYKGSFTYLDSGLQPTGTSNAVWLSVNAATVNSSTGAAESGSGALKQIDLPADAGGDSSGALDWKLEYKPWFQSANYAQRGSQGITLLTAENEVVLAVYVYKSNKSNNDSVIELTAGDSTVLQNINAGGVYNTSKPYEGNPFCNGIGIVKAQKSGSRIDVQIGAMNFTLFSEDIVAKKVTKIQIHIKGYKGVEPLTRNYITGLSFVKKGVESPEFQMTGFTDTFNASQTIEIDGNRGQLIIDGWPKPELERTGAEYFLIPPGVSKVTVASSEWYSGDIETTIRFQEAWL